VRELSLLPGALPLHTGHMANDARPTAFVTGASGFLGSELVRVLVARGYQVFGLARSVESTQHLRRASAIAIRGDLLVPGQWQDEAAAHWVFHIPPGAPARARSWRQDERLAHTRAVMDRAPAGRGRRRRSCPSCNLIEGLSTQGPTRQLSYLMCL
jgi:nucleoside-diphosphate-sugar epimerase